jgi:hypothetical protein
LSCNIITNRKACDLKEQKYVFKGAPVDEGMRWMNFGVECQFSTAAAANCALENEALGVCCAVLKSRAICKRWSSVEFGEQFVCAHKLRQKGS